MTYSTYEFTAFTEADLLAAGADGSGVNCGDTFTMAGAATTCFEVTDNDSFLSGDSCHNENADDHYGQQATITGENGNELGNGGQIYAEKYFWVCDDAGNWYVMIEIEQEGSGDDYFTFYTGHGYTVPEEGTELTVYSSCNVKGSWIDFDCLGAGEKEADPGWIKGRLTIDADCNDNEWNDETGQWDEGIEGQTVKLLDLDGNVVATSVTDAHGNYMFDVAPGEYRVQFPEIEGTEFSAQNSGVAEHFDSDADAHGLTDIITVSSGQTVANVDAGVKPNVGSISGTAFCDTDCDGINGEVSIVPGHDYTIEAEHMYEYGFQTVHGAQASGGQLVKLNCLGGSGELCTDFNGKTGVYDVKIRVQDESDGQSIIKLKVNGHIVEAIKLDGDTDGVGDNNGGFSTYVVQDVALSHGDDLSLAAWGDHGEWVRIDKIDLEGEDTTIFTPEPTKADVLIKLLNADGTAVLDAAGNEITTTTDEHGNYSFDNVPVGDYKIMGVAPDGTEFTIQDAGDDDSIDSDVNAGGVSDVITVVKDGNVDIDLGLKPAAPEVGSIAGRYFCDENQDGAETDAAGNLEAGVAGATVWLLLQGTGVVASTTTDADGNYSFDGLEAGNYSVRFEDPDDVSSATEGKNFIAADQGDDATDSDVVNVGDAGNGNTVTFTLAAGENKTDVDGGIEQQFMVCDDPDAVLIDFEGFAAGTVIDDEYAGIGVTISAQRVKNNDAANDAMIFDSANPTGGDGDLQTFNQGNLLIVSEDNDSGDPDDAVGGVFTFDFANPSRVFDLKLVDSEEGGTIALFDADGNSLGVIDLPNLPDGGLEQIMIDVDGVSQMVVTLNGSGAIDDICIVPGEPQVGSISGRYFCDENRDDTENDGSGGFDVGVGDVTVRLLDAAGNEIATTQTDSNGGYVFNDLPAGDYRVAFDADPTGKTFVNQDVGAEGEDSDANAISGVTDVITLGAGEDRTDIDVGVEEVDPGDANDCAFFIQGPVLTKVMMDEQPDGSIKVMIDVLDATGQIGDLRGVFFEMADESLLSLLQVSGADVGNVVIDANNVTDVGNGSNVNGEVVRNFGEFDVGVEIGTPGATPDDIRSTMFTLSRSDGEKLEADDFSFTDFGIRLTSVGEEGGDRGESLKIGGTVPLIICEKPGSLSGTYFCDDDRDGVDDGAANGDADIAGKLVTLLNADGTAVVDFDGNPVDAVLTDEFGNYRFDNISAGDYVVMFEGVDGKSFIAPNVGETGAGDVADDSDVVDADNGKTDLVSVFENEETTDVDAGVSLDLGSLSGRYFCDDDGDGLDNDGDTGGEGLGVDGILVTLLDANDNPVLDGNNQPVTVLTGPNGAYSFTGLVPGIYGVSFASTPPMKEFTTANVDNDVSDDIDSDAIVNDFGSAVISGINVFGNQDTPDNDVGVRPSNEDPEADDVMAAVCADDMATINLIDTVTDPDGDMVSITSISDADETALVGESITLAGGGIATLNGDGTVSFNPNNAYDDLLIREMEMDQFSFTAEDGMGGSDTALADIKICGALNTIETIAEGFVDGNGDPLQASYRVDTETEIDLDTSPPTITTDFPITVIADSPLEPRLEAMLGSDGEEVFDDNLAYCVDNAGVLEFGVDVPSNLYIVGDDAMNTGNAAIADAVDQEENLDIVTWILNQEFQNTEAEFGDRNYTFQEVQGAIWFFTDGNSTSAINSQEIISLAMDSGEGFVAGEGDKVAVLFDPIEEDRQTYIVGVEFDALQEDCDCIL